LLSPEAQARLAHPPAEAVELARALVSALTQAGNARTPEAAVDVVLNAVSKLRDGMAVKGAQGGHAPSRRPPAPEASCQGAGGAGGGRRRAGGAGGRPAGGGRAPPATRWADAVVARSARHIPPPCGEISGPARRRCGRAAGRRRPAGGGARSAGGTPRWCACG